MRRRAQALAAVLALVALAACTGDDAGLAGSDGSSTAPTGPVECVPAPPPLVVDQIDDALAAVAVERPGPQRFFEVNATAAVVNMFFATTDAAGRSATVPYSWAAGQLRGEGEKEASGNTFEAAAIAFDPERVLSCVLAQLPDSQLDAFVVEGGPDGAVRYSVVLTSQQGGQLVVEVNGQGQVLAVDAV